ncbi:hypothetical protein HSRCO_0785 [Halanaeroarchaeum sp. HSR-CO]|nr:hypothetical protein HSRCO_0785 [Halanaeroarchaeum sp. HSR-CO]
MLHVVVLGAGFAAQPVVGPIVEWPVVGSIGEIPAGGSIHEDVVDHRPSSARPARTANDGTNHDP